MRSTRSMCMPSGAGVSRWAALSALLGVLGTLLRCIGTCGVSGCSPPPSSMPSPVSSSIAASSCWAACWAAPPGSPGMLASATSPSASSGPPAAPSRLAWAR
eukprot:9561554-Heterocapsa_arctica.AAC.1